MPLRPASNPHFPGPNQNASASSASLLILPLLGGLDGSSFSSEQKRPNNFEGRSRCQELAPLTMAITDKLSSSARTRSGRIDGETTRPPINKSCAA